VPENGVSRTTSGGSQSERRVWRCNPCRKQFSVLTGTIIHATKISVRTWVMVMFEMCASKNGVAAREVERKYALNPRTAWHMLHRIREAMSHDDFVLFSGNVMPTRSTSAATLHFVTPTTVATRVVAQARKDASSHAD
jgi:transposase-like protein